MRRNLDAGIRLGFFLPVRADAFRVSQDQLFGLTATNLALAIACDRIATLPPVDFYPDALAVHLAWILLSFFLAYLGAREAGRPEQFLRLAVMLQSPVPFAWLLYAGIHLAADHAPVPGFLTDSSVLGPLFALWTGAYAGRALAMTCGLSAVRSGCLTALYAFLLIGAIHFLPDWRPFWTEDELAEGESTSEPALDIEATFHAQHDRVERALAGILPGRPGVVDLYLVAFGADATQDVFRKEVTFVQQLFDERFDTKDRSLVLVNHEGTIDSEPLASASNLAAVLEGLGERMDPEDVLFLFLTGHGARSHELAVSLPPLPLNDLEPDRLAAMLAASGIGWRVVAVSACYAGGFIAPLADEHTLVLTAAAANRRSFGCSNEAEFTYFGEAFFKDALAEELSFVAAFERARAGIAEREAEEDKTPSLPQIATAEPIQRQLEQLVQRLQARAAMARSL